MDVQQQVAYQEEGDYLDRLKPGYHFCPTDAEILVYYLKRKIETGEHPQCRLHEVNLNEHDPQVLTDGYRSCDGKWYFLTPRERQYTHGKRPSRRIKTGGFWRTSQADKAVYDDGGQVVGRKRNFVHYDVNEKRTPWLMHEYITNDPDLPVGTNGNKLSNCVLCKIYKKETNRTNNINHDEQVENISDQDEQTVLNDEPSPRRRRLSGSNQVNEHELVQTREENHLLETGDQMLPPMRFMSNSNQESVHNSDTTSGLTARIGYAQNFQDQTISMVQEDNLSLDTRAFTAPMGYTQYLHDQTLPFEVQEDNLNFDTSSGFSEPMGYAFHDQITPMGYAFLDQTLPMGYTFPDQNLPMGYACDQDQTLPMGYACQDQTLPMVVEEDNMSISYDSLLAIISKLPRMDFV